jgi:hypothetical protein
MAEDIPALVLSEVLLLFVRLAYSLTYYFKIAGLKTLGALGNLKFNLVTLSEGLKPFPLDGRVMNKYVLAAINFDKSIPLLIVKPFNFSSH